VRRRPIPAQLEVSPKSIDRPRQRRGTLATLALLFHSPLTKLHPLLKSVSRRVVVRPREATEAVARRAAGEECIGPPAPTVSGWVHSSTLYGIAGCSRARITALGRGLNGTSKAGDWGW